MMNRTGAVNALRDLAESSDERSQAAKLTTMIDDVEAALAAGVRRTAIVETLAANGLSMTLKNFETALYRIRRRRNRARPAAGAAVAATGTQPHLDPPAGSAFEELDGLDPKERRERLADKFIQAGSSSPYLKRLLKEQKS